MSKLISEKQASYKSGYSVGELRRKRAEKKGPPYIQGFYGVLYPEDELDQWINCHKQLGYITDYGNFDKYSDIAKWW